MKTLYRGGLRCIVPGIFRQGAFQESYQRSTLSSRMIELHLRWLAQQLSTNKEQCSYLFYISRTPVQNKRIHIQREKKTLFLSQKDRCCWKWYMKGTVVFKCRSEELGNIYFGPELLRKSKITWWSVRHTNKLKNQNKRRKYVWRKFQTTHFRS